MTLDLDPDRAAKAARALRDGAVEVQRVEPGTYRVRSFTADRQYTVRLNGEQRCDCPDHSIRGAVCKHQLVAVLVEGLTP